MRRIIITLQGKVQGVGFRPFVYRLAVQYNLQGHTRNTSNGVNIDVQGDDADIDSFLADLINKKPGPAAVSQLSITEASQVFYPPADDDGSGRPFRIKESDSSGDAELALLPDTAICQRCLEELFEPLNRRYRYPFLHCVSCGPRFSLFSRMPFDRLNTSMADFPMCRECEREYGNPFDRRFHSQTNCCSGCGPYLTFLDSTGRQLAGKDGALEMAATELKRGAIVALKNTGGYMLLADAANEQTVAKLRIRKRRRQKPFALLVPTIRHAEELVEICAAAKEVLDSPAAPIVLLKKAKGAALVGRNVAPENPYHGIMLPHTGLQHLLTRAFRAPLVATSGNTSDLPICIDDDDALNKLSGVADFFLSHNRQIIHRLDDSIVHIINGRPVVLRKARGYIPCALELQTNALLSPKAVFAAGGQTKNAFAFAKGQMIYSSQHVGDLNSAETCQIYEQDVKKWKTLLAASPDLCVIDEHPGYFSSHYCSGHKLKTKAIQHHQAHVWSGMVDSNLTPPFLGIAWDGTGFGQNGAIWGGEAFAVTGDDMPSMHRIGSVVPFRLPGSEKAVREPRRSALGLLYAAYHGSVPSDCQGWVETAFTPEEYKVLCSALKKKANAPMCTSIGRLFDGISALLGLCLINDFEGHAALALEDAASKAQTDLAPYPVPICEEEGIHLMDWQPMIRKVIQDIAEGIPATEISLAFHQTLANSICQLADLLGVEKVLLTGGAMQNKLLAEKTISLLQEKGFKPYWHHRIPPNDGGLAIGQIVGGLFSMDPPSA